MGFMGFNRGVAEALRRRAGARRNAAVLPVFEAMEGRQLMSGVLNVTANAPHNSVALGVNAAGGITTDVNGVQHSYTAGQWSSVQLSSSGDSDYVLVTGTAAPTTLNVANDAMVRFMGLKGLQDVKSNVWVNSLPGSSHFHVAVNDTNDTAPRTGTMDISGGYESVSGLSPAPIWFAAANADSLLLETGKAPDQVNVRRTAAAINVTVENAGGNDTVTMGGVAGAGGGASGIHGEVAVVNSSGLVHLVVDDQDGGPAKGRADIILDGGNLFDTITGASPATITYGYNDVSDVVVKTPTVGAVVEIKRTDKPTSIIGHSAANAQPDYIIVGGDGMDSTMQYINGAVTLSNPTGYDGILLGDIGDPYARLLQMEAQSATGLSPAPINWTNADTSNVNVYLPAVGGSGVIVRNTGKYTEVNGFSPENGPADTVTIGDGGSVQGILGSVGVYSSGHSNIIIDDSADAVSRNVTLDVGLASPPYTTYENGLVNGLAPAQIRYRSTGIGSVTVKGGGGGNAFTVKGTPRYDVENDAGGGPTINLNTGTGSDVVNVQKSGLGTTLNVQGQSGQDTVNFGFGGTVQEVKGTVNVQNTASYTQLTVENSLDTTPRTFSLSAFTPAGTSYPFGSIKGLAPGVINYRAVDMRDPLNIRGGGGGNTVTVEGTPSKFLGGGLGNTINLSSGSGADTIYVKAVSAGTTLNLDGQSGIDSATLTTAQIFGVVNKTNIENVTSNVLSPGTLAGTNTFGDSPIRALGRWNDLLG